MDEDNMYDREGYNDNYNSVEKKRHLNHPKIGDVRMKYYVLNIVKQFVTFAGKYDINYQLMPWKSLTDHTYYFMKIGNYNVIDVMDTLRGEANSTLLGVYYLNQYFYFF